MPLAQLVSRCFDFIQSLRSILNLATAGSLLQIRSITSRLNASRHFFSSGDEVGRVSLGQYVTSCPGTAEPTSPSVSSSSLSLGLSRTFGGTFPSCRLNLSRLVVVAILQPVTKCSEIKANANTNRGWKKVIKYTFRSSELLCGSFNSSASTVSARGYLYSWLGCRLVRILKW